MRVMRLSDHSHKTREHKVNGVTPSSEEGYSLRGKAGGWGIAESARGKKTGWILVGVRKIDMWRHSASTRKNSSSRRQYKRARGPGGFRERVGGGRSRRAVALGLASKICEKDRGAWPRAENLSFIGIKIRACWGGSKQRTYKPKS